jgi:hypothetical protein
VKRTTVSGPGGYGPGFWAAVVVGVVVAAVGVRTYLDVYADTGRRVALAVWIVGSDIAHDVLVVPVTIAIGVVVHRRVPAHLRPAVRFGGIASGTVLLLAWRPLVHSGAAKHNATVQPLDYPTATLTVLAVVWVVAFVSGVLAERRHRRVTRSIRSSTRS